MHLGVEKKKLFIFSGVLSESTLPHNREPPSNAINPSLNRCTAPLIHLHPTQKLAPMGHAIFFLPFAVVFLGPHTLLGLDLSILASY